MSYLIENSLVITQHEYMQDEGKYSHFQVYKLEDHFILSENTKPFFSLYDIALFCKKKYKNDKLFLIAHRYFDSVENVKVTELYIFNTLNIFEKSLTSYIKIKEDKLQSKQKVVQDSIKIALKLSNTNGLHVILGDNIKEHEIVEYLKYQRSDSIEFFEDEYKFLNHTSNEDNINSGIDFKSSRISKILDSVRVLEPKEAKTKKFAFLGIIVLLFIYSIEDIASFVFDGFKQEVQREIRNSQNSLYQMQDNLKKRDDYNLEVLLTIQQLKQKSIYTLEDKK